MKAVIKFIAMYIKVIKLAQKQGDKQVVFQAIVFGWFPILMAWKEIDKNDEQNQSKGEKWS